MGRRKVDNPMMSSVFTVSGYYKLSIFGDFFKGNMHTMGSESTEKSTDTFLVLVLMWELLKETEM